MKLFAMLAFAGVTAMASVHPAAAQQNNCDALSGTPLMCVENHSSYPVVAVQAASSNSFGNNWIPIPGGTVQPGGLSVIRFPTGFGSDCRKFVVVRTMTGSTHVYPNVDVCHSTKFIVAGW